MVSQDQVTSCLRALLPTLDLQTATERIIVTQLETKMGESLVEFKTLIRDEIDNFLVNMDEDDDFEEKAPVPVPAPAPPPAKGTKRANPNAQKAKPEAKRAAGVTGVSGQQSVKEESKPIVSTPTQLDANTWEISSGRRIKVDKWSGKAMVNIREFYSDANGEMQPGKKGLSMPLDQYQALLAGVQAINAAVDNEGSGEGYAAELSRTRKVTVRQYGKTLMVDLREFYDKDGGLAPGKKGISLPVDQWRKVVELLPEVTAAVEAMTGAPLDPHAAAPSALPAPAAAPTPDPASEGGAASAAAKPAQSSEGGGRVIELSNNRRASVEMYRNKPLVSVREYYQDKSSGEMKPSPRGLSMNEAQWSVFVENAAAVDAAVEDGGGKGGFVVELSGSARRVTVEQYKGTTTISLREFYQKDGKWLPGKKGINLTTAQWQTLYSNLGSLKQAFADASA